MAGVVFQELLELSLLIGGTSLKDRRHKEFRLGITWYTISFAAQNPGPSFVQEVSVRSIQVSNMYIHV